MNDNLFNYLVATDTLDEFLGYKKSDNTDDEDDEDDDTEDEKE